MRGFTKKKFSDVWNETWIFEGTRDVSKCLGYPKTCGEMTANSHSRPETLSPLH